MFVFQQISRNNNIAISEKAIAQDLYPFGKRRYMIPSPKSVKKALSREQLKTLFYGIPQTEGQQKAKDFWFFSYMCNGMNIKDIALLRFENLYNKETIIFRRAKTSKTNRTGRPVVINLNDYALKIIDKYSNKNNSPHNYIFQLFPSMMILKQFVQKLRI